MRRERRGRRARRGCQAPQACAEHAERAEGAKHPRHAPSTPSAPRVPRVPGMRRGTIAGVMSSATRIGSIPRGGYSDLASHQRSHLACSHSFDSPGRSSGRRDGIQANQSVWQWRPRERTHDARALCIPHETAPTAPTAPVVLPLARMRKYGGCTGPRMVLAEKYRRPLQTFLPKRCRSAFGLMVNTTHSLPTFP